MDSASFFVHTRRQTAVCKATLSAGFPASQERTDEHHPVYRTTIMNETLISAISYLYENMTDPIDAETLTKELYTSENILRVQFKNRLNSSYKQVLSQFRVRYAEALLTTTSLPTVDIAIESGFGSDRTMARVFYNINGISPGEFRKARKLHQKASK